MKRRIGRAMRQVQHRDPEAAAVLDRLYHEFQPALGNADLFGERVGQMQREVNQAWTDYLARAGEFDRMFMADGTAR